jgi:signal peptidase I
LRNADSGRRRNVTREIGGAPGLDGLPLPESPSERASQSSRNRSTRAKAAWVLLALAVLVVLGAAFVAQIYEIPSGSMETTLHGCGGCENDRVLVDKLAYRFDGPKRGDIVVFTLPNSWNNSELPVAGTSGNPLVRALQALGHAIGVTADRPDLIKRVIAVGGQTVSCCDARNRLLVDGKGVDEPYIYFAPAFGSARQASFGPVTVPPGQLWVMGDSRNNSDDSRAEGNGPVPLADVIGKARMIVWPLGRVGWLV